MQVQRSSVTLQGQVVERSADVPIIAATVELVGVSATRTDSSGRFRFTDVLPGRHTIKVEALGYSSEEVTVVLTRDTTVVIELGIQAIEIDTMRVTPRTVTVRGQVVDAASGVQIIDAQVGVGAPHESMTDPLGRFRFRGVPVGTASLKVRGFGYLPFEASFNAVRDTTLVARLEPDPVAQRMIEEQIARIERRSRALRTVTMTPITRADLLRNLNATAVDVIQDRFGQSVERLQCMLIDDVPITRGDPPGTRPAARPPFSKTQWAAELGMILPDRLERVEVLQGGRMLRLYTRDFIRRMVAGGVVLRAPLYVGPPELPTTEPYCR